MCSNEALCALLSIMRYDMEMWIYLRLYHNVGILDLSEKEYVRPESESESEIVIFWIYIEYICKYMIIYTESFTLKHDCNTADRYCILDISRSISQITHER